MKKRKEQTDYNLLLLLFDILTFIWDAISSIGELFS